MITSNEKAKIPMFDIKLKGKHIGDYYPTVDKFHPNIYAQSFGLSIEEMTAILEHLKTLKEPA